ncbi:G2/mitotic-specific cyclin [Irineochytrium annulatum]|nr:G2/mitotic-specific cyclin [Irineochytrium annulatum]
MNPLPVRTRRGAQSSKGKTVTNDENDSGAAAATKGGRKLRSNAKSLTEKPEPVKKAPTAKAAAAGKKERGALNELKVQNVANTTKVGKPRAAKAQGVAKKVAAPEAKKEAVKEAAKKAADDRKAAKTTKKTTTAAVSKAVTVEVEVKTRVTKSKAVAKKKATTKAKAAAKKPEPEPIKEVLLKLAPQEADVPMSDHLQIILPEEPEQDWDDLDAEDAGDPLMVSEYVNEIFSYLKELEVATLANPDYMSAQTNLQWPMRTVLVDWLIDLHSKFRLLPETLYMAVNLIDRFLSLRVVSTQKLQLVGVTALLIASKYEEIQPVSLKSMIYATDESYTEEQLMRAERYVLSVMDFNLRYPSPMSFLRRCSKADQYDIRTRTLAKYFMEISLVDHRFLSISPSLIAGAGLFLARDMLGSGEWDRNLVHYSGYSKEEVEPCVNMMMEFLEAEHQQDALFRKYSSKRFMKVATVVKDYLDARDLPDV